MLDVREEDADTDARRSVVEATSASPERDEILTGLYLFSTTMRIIEVVAFVDVAISEIARPIEYPPFVCFIA